MEHDVQTLRFLSDDERCADLINGVGFAGRQVIAPGDLSELDSQVLYRVGRPWKRRIGRAGKKLYRDLIRKAAFGVNFVIIGIESQDEVHYLMPLRTLSYDAGEYEKQAAKIRKKVRRSRGIGKAEFLSGFRKTDRLKPCVTFVLYFGKNWDGARSLYELLDWTDIPEEMKQLVGNYPLNLIEVRKLTDTSVFKTDIRQVFDFIRCAEDQEEMRKLILNNAEYRTIEEDAYDFAVGYTNAVEFIDKKDEYKEGGKINMCKAITDMLREERNEGALDKTRVMVRNMLQRGFADEDICALAECEQSLVDEVRCSIR